MNSNKRLINGFLNKRNVFAVVGASKNPEKYGHRVYKDLKEAGYIVYPLNPNADEVLGDKCYAGLNNLPTTPDVVDIVVPPDITENIVRDCEKLGISKIWMQPGSESDSAIAFCEDKNIEVLHGVCIMIERRRTRKP